MTGLDYENDEIIEIACFITDAELNLLDTEGFQIVIHQSEERMSAMDEWCRKTHGRSGLTAAVVASDISPETAAERLLAYVKKYLPERRKALLAGNSVHADRAFLRRPPYSQVVEHLHHRILDVSTIKEAARRWKPRFQNSLPFFGPPFPRGSSCRDLSGPAIPSGSPACRSH